MTLREQTNQADQPSAALSTSPISGTRDGPAASVPSPSPAAVDGDPGPAACSPEAEEGEAFPQPRLRLKIHDLDHPGAAKFLGAVNAATVLSTAVHKVLRLLYRSPSDRHTTVPPTRSVTLVLRDMGGVAYTTGTSLDNDHKEIHFSLRYIDSIRPAARLAAEITGVLTHEVVHCCQWDALGTCPRGLIEGVADWVRLNCGLSPPHWKRETGGEWDRGYQHTAYFLQYLEGRFGEGTVRRLNEKLRQTKYVAESFWPELLGQTVDQLYCDYIDGSKDNDDRGTRLHASSFGR